MSEEPDEFGVTDTNRRKMLKLAGGLAGVGSIAGCSGGESSQEHGTIVPELGFLLPQFLSFAEHGRQISDQFQNALGLNINYEVIDWNTYLSRVFSEPFDYPHMAHASWAGTPERIDPEFIFSTLVSDSPQNNSYYENPEYDEAYNRYLQTFDEEEKNQAIADIQDIILEDVPTLEYFRSPTSNPTNTGNWDIEPTQLLGNGAAATQTHLLAEPTGDESTLVLGWNGRYNQPNPMNVLSGPIWAFLGQAFDTLRRVDTDGSYINWAVEEFEVIDELTIDLTLREGMTFHDGESVTASDLAFTLNMHSDYAFPKYAVFGDFLGGASAETDLTVRVNFAEPYAPFLTAGAISFKIVPEHIWGDIVATDDPVNYQMDDQEAIGSGPFQVTELSDQRIVLEAYDDHWMSPAYDELRVVSQDSLEGIRANIAEGNINMVTQEISPDIAQRTAEGNDNLEVLSAAGLQWSNILVDNSQYPTQDRPFRRALQLALNAEVLKESIYLGTGNVATGSLIHPQRDIGQDVPVLSANVEEARSVLSEAGYTWDSDDRLHYPQSYDV
jgi:peptide/nickel transport system substrate-binding protein